MNSQNLLLSAFKIIRKSHTYLLRGFFLSLSLLCILVSVSLSSYAENFTLYQSVGTNDTITRNLIAIYQNSPEYDPFYEFEVARVGQYDYRLFYGKDISSGDYNFYQYVGVPTTSGINYQYSGGTGSNLYLEKRGYMTVGNVENSFSSPEANQFKFQYVLIVFTFLFAVLALFKIFKQKVQFRSSRRWKM